MLCPKCGYDNLEVDWNDRKFYCSNCDYEGTDPDNYIGDNQE